MAYFLSVLVRMSILGSLLAGLLLLVRPVLQKRMSMAVSYYLWLLVLIRLCMPSGITIPMPDAVAAAFDRLGIYELLEEAALRTQADKAGTGNGSGVAYGNPSGTVYGNGADTVYGNGTGAAYGNQSGAAYGNGTGTANGSGSDGTGLAYGNGTVYDNGTGAAYGNQSGAAYGNGTGIAYGNGIGAAYGSGPDGTGATYGNGIGAVYGNPSGTAYGNAPDAVYGNPSGAAYRSRPEQSGMDGGDQQNQARAAYRNPFGAVDTDWAASGQNNQDGIDGSGRRQDGQPKSADDAQPHTGAAGFLRSAAQFVLCSLLGAGDTLDCSIWWFVLWGIGAAVSMCWYIGGYLYFSYIVRRSAQKATIDMQKMLRELEPAGRVRLFRCSLVSTPVLIGMIHPVIVVPVGIEDQEQLKDIFAHELTHARRYDLLYKWFTAAAVSLHWFNPMMIWIRREIGRTCELSCDEAVMRGMDADGRYHYGQTLLALAAVPAAGHSNAVLSFCREKECLKERMVFIVKYRKKSTAAMLLSVLLAFAVSGCALVFGTDLSAADAAGAGRLSYAGSPDTTENSVLSGQGSETENGVSFAEMKAAYDRMLLAQKSAEQENGQFPDSGAQGREYVRSEGALYETFLEILKGKAAFLYASEGNAVDEVLIADVPGIFSPDSRYASMNRFALVDLDGDDEQELVLQVIDVAGDLGGYMVLHGYEGKVYGFSSDYKTFENLKADGTYSYQSFAGTEWGIGRMKFTKTECMMERIAYASTDVNWEKFSYVVNGRAAAAKKYKAAEKKQDKKQDAVWHPFTDQGLVEAFDTDSQPPSEETSAVHEQPLIENINDMYLYRFPVRVAQGQKLTIALYTEQLGENYFAVEQILVYSGAQLLQAIDVRSVPGAQDYAWDGLYVNQGAQVGEPDIRDVNFDGAQDFGLMTVGTYSKNIPYSYFLWNEEKQCFDYGFTLFGAGALEVDAEHKQLVESEHDVYGEYKTYYKYKPDGTLQRE